MKSNKLRKQINENAIPLDDYPETYLSKRKAEVDKHRSYQTKFKNVLNMLKEMRWQDLEFRVTGTGTRTCYPILPQPIRAAIKELKRENSTQATADFTQGGYSFYDTLSNETEPGNRDIYMQVESESSGQRSHFPNNGIPAAIKGANLGYKLYRALLQKFKYLRSNTAGTTAKDQVWQSIVSPKKDAAGNLTEDDVHGIVSRDAVFAMIKSLSDSEKVRLAKRFIESNVTTDSITARNFAIDPELKALLPADLLAEVDPTRRAAAQKAREAREAEARRAREAQVLTSHADRIALYAPFGIDAHDWNVGDYIVVKQYLMDPSYNQLPVRKVIAHEGREWVAIKTSDIAEYERTQRIPNDARRTSNKESWVKSRPAPGQYGYVAPEGTSATTAQPAAAQATATDGETELTSQQKNRLRTFTRNDDYDIYVSAADWNNKDAFIRNKKPMKAGLVKRSGNSFEAMDASTGNPARTLTEEELRNLSLVKMDKVQLTSKADVRPNDWVYVKEHIHAIGRICVVYRVTQAENRQPGVYIFTGDDRPTLIQRPQTLWKITPSQNQPARTAAPATANPATTKGRAATATAATTPSDVARANHFNLKRLTRRGMNNIQVFVDENDWTNRNRMFVQRKPMFPYLAEPSTTTVRFLNMRKEPTLSFVQGMDREDFDTWSSGADVVRLNAVRIDRKSAVSPGDWVYVSDHRTAGGLICPVYRVTQAENRQPGIYIWTGDNRPVLIQHPQTLYKLSLATNESVKIKSFDQLFEAEATTFTKDLAKEMLEFLDSNGEHRLVSKYKGDVPDEIISHVIGAWATSVKPLPEILDDFWKTHIKIRG